MERDEKLWSQAKWSTRPLTPAELERMERDIAMQKVIRAERELEEEERERRTDNIAWLLVGYFALALGVIAFAVYRAWMI